MKNDSYFLATGETDRQRLAILNKIYNPAVHHFLKESGLKPGMTVLEVGCGMGENACWLAQQVGATGKVVAIDSSAEQLKIAADKAKEANISNIEFKKMDVRDLSSLKESFDFAYNRWVFIFLENPETGYQQVYNKLKNGGIIVSEETSFLEPGQFSFPHSDIVDFWFDLGRRFFEAKNLDSNLGNRLYFLFKKVGFKNIFIKANQQILTTAAEKSVLRLGWLTLRDAYLKNNVLSLEQFEQGIKKFSQLENEDTIVGFFRNNLVKGVK